MPRCVPVALIALAVAGGTVMSGALGQTPPPLAAHFNPSFGDLMNTLCSRGMPSLGSLEGSRTADACAAASITPVATSAFGLPGS